MDADANAADQSCAGQAISQGRIGQLLPGDATVRRLEQTASGTAAAEEPGLPQVVVHPGIDDARVLRVDRNVAGAGRLVDEQGPLPGIPAVRRTEHATFLVRV